MKYIPCHGLFRRACDGDIRILPEEPVKDYQRSLPEGL
jgi:hypothetical protein